MKRILMKRHLDTILRRFARARVLVVGDLMLDQFVWGRVDRISPEAPVPVVQVVGESVHLGGAANVAHNVRSLGGKAEVCGIVGRDEAGKRLIEELGAVGAGRGGILATRVIATIRKTRIVAHNQQVVRVDHEQQLPNPATARRLVELVRRYAGKVDAVIVSDYGKGAITPELLSELATLSHERGLRVVVDPKKPNYTHYRGVTLATPNLAEASAASGIEIRDERSLRQAGERLLECWKARAILITRGERGMTLVQPRRKLRHFAAAAHQVYDVTGAGDTVVAVCALALAAGASFEEAAVLANAAAGIVVTKLGTATATVAELRGAPLRLEKA
jgi:D-beta-D-heptose 7-phosphate kinase/D-beta-D-heptose 1-phosphate adenosyltransferase